MKKLSRSQLYIRKVAKEGFLIIIGCLFMAMGTSLFLLPNQLSSGGFAGIATIIYYLFNLPLGTTMLILNLLKKEDMYGYQMIKKLKEKSENVFELKEGTLYPILHALEEKGLISSYWDETTAKRRKYYAITEKGKKQLKDKKEEWKKFSNGINHVLGGVSFAN